MWTCQTFKPTHENDKFDIMRKLCGRKQNDQTFLLAAHCEIRIPFNCLSTQISERSEAPWLNPNMPSNGPWWKKWVHIDKDKQQNLHSFRCNHIFFWWTQRNLSQKLIHVWNWNSMDSHRRTTNLNLEKNKHFTFWIKSSYFIHWGSLLGFCSPWGMTNGASMNSDYKHNSISYDYSYYGQSVQTEITLRLQKLSKSTTFGFECRRILSEAMQTENLETIQINC